MRRPLIAGNWKMNNSVEESINLVRDLRDRELSEKVDVLICPPFTSLYAIINEIKNSSIKVGAQNMYYEDKGAFTGEVSPAMLKSIGVEYVIIGHSERRQYFNETDQLINKKLKAALTHGLIPILCVGETLEQREEGMEKETVKAQIVKAFKNIEKAEKVVIAYEPVWAIGTGKVATSEQAEEMSEFIRSIIATIYNSEVADNIIIQYGGSVKSLNISEIMSQPNIDGVLVGGASLNAEEFAKIVNFGEDKKGC
ncbi:MAG TPA: triose-phosphate isomerase [Tissierellia bacterium]|nr:triose-phosphate isomerase [Tissierellia bacterium]